MRRRIRWAWAGAQANFDRYKFQEAVWKGGYSRLELTAKSRAVAIYLSHRAKAGTRHDLPMTCWCSQGQVAEETALSRSSVQRAINELQYLGFLDIEKTYKTNEDGQLREFNGYHLCLPERVAEQFRQAKPNKANGSAGSGITVNHQGRVKRQSGQEELHTGRVERQGEAVTKTSTMYLPRGEFFNSTAKDLKLTQQNEPASEQEVLQEKERQLQEVALKLSQSTDS